MTRAKVEIRRQPADIGKRKPWVCHVFREERHLRLVGYVPGYAVVRRKGAKPFCLSRKEWDALPLATREEEARTES